MKRAMVFLCLSAMVGYAIIAIGAPVAKPNSERVRKELDAIWADLLSPDERIATRAALSMAAWKHDAVAYLEANLRPLKLSKTDAKPLIAKLASGDLFDAEPASKTLTDFDPRLAFNRNEIEEMLMKDNLAARRLSAVLCGLPLDTFEKGPPDAKWHFHSPDGNRWCFNYGTEVKNHFVSNAVAGIGTIDRKPTWVRAARAVAILEFIDSPNARLNLEQMASGNPEAFPTKAANSALERLKK